MAAGKPDRCGTCTACCDTFPVNWLGKGPNEPCEHCLLGCQIHDSKPDECLTFECMYYQTEVPLDLRPDQCGVIFEKLSDRLIYGTVIARLTAKAAKQVYAFQAQGFSVVLAHNIGNSSRTVLAEDHDPDEIQAEFQAHVEARYGCLRD